MDCMDLKNGENVIFCACRRGNLEVIQYLVEKTSIDVLAQNNVRGFESWINRK